MRLAQPASADSLAGVHEKTRGLAGTFVGAALNGPWIPIDNT
jgi:hypothetical protein